MFKTIERIHFVGIGGSGMSGIAEVLLNLGYRVSGSDLKKSEVTERLRKLGAVLHYGHHQKNVGPAQVVVISSAVHADNPEVVRAHKQKIPVIPRIEMLAELARLKYTIAVGGTHGKTTTTSMVAAILDAAGMDPTFIVGGKVHKCESGARLGRGEFLVAEADESDGSFLKLAPTISIITNIDSDHLDYYGSMDVLRKAFAQFGNRVPFYGCAVVCAEDFGVRAVLPEFKRRVATYGLDRKYDYSAAKIVASEKGCAFDLLRAGKRVGRIVTQLSGKHNVLNSLAACACALELGIAFKKVAAGLARFESVARRLDKRGEKNGALWIDDYGHHPTEIKATLQALRERFPRKRLTVLFQPHRYSRTRLLLKEFAGAFGDADELLLLPIYPAGEKPIAGVSSEGLLRELHKRRVKAQLVSDRDLPLLKKNLDSDTIFLTLGAGDVWKVGQTLFSDSN